MSWLSSLFRKSPVFYSAINGEITLRKRYGKPAVVTGDITQSGGELVRMWETLLTEEKKRKTPVHSALLLGVAGGMILRLFHEYFPKARLFGVEIDPVMITIAKEYFDLKNDLSVHLYEEDAIKWVKKEKKKYDLIVIDLYIKQLNAPGTRDIVFLKGLKKITSEKGVILYNSHFQKDKPKEYEEIVKNCKNIFSEVEEVYSYPLNRVLRLTI